MPEKVIKSLEVKAGRFNHTFEIGQVFAGQTIADIIKHNEEFALYNREDELITKVHLPVLTIHYEYIESELSA